MSKGDQTREMILHRAAQLFNRKGFFGASMSDIMQATGLEKGGIYNYFQSKDDLALQAFDYAVDIERQAFAEAIKGRYEAADRLMGVATVFHALATDSLLPGGCPVMNTAIAADDAHPALRQRALDAMDEMHDFLRRIIQRGIERGQLRADLDADATATIFYAMMEGAVTMSRLSTSTVYIDRMMDHVSAYLSSLRP